MNLISEENKLKQVIANFFIETPSNTKLATVMAALRLAEDPAQELFSILNKLSEYNVVLAGGAITSIVTGAHVNDLDFYMEDPSKKDEIIALLSKYFKEPPFQSPNCITFKRKSTGSRKVWTAQLITRFAGPPKRLFDNFDFTITTGAYSFRRGEFEFGERYLQDLASKRLVFMGSSMYPICALWRTKKYQAKGYYLPGSTIMHISLSIVRLEIKTYKELKEQLLGIDTMFLQNLFNDKKDEYLEELPVDYGKFLADAFEYLNVYAPEPDADDAE